jgi:hypothetical protein
MSATIVQFYLSLRNAVKIYHWITKSYPRHKATDAFVENMDKLIDRFVEVYIGRHGRKDLSKIMTLELPILNESAVTKYLAEARAWLSDKLPSLLDKKDTDLINIRDEMLAEINQALYLFTLQ